MSSIRVKTHLSATKRGYTSKVFKCDVPLQRKRVPTYRLNIQSKSKLLNISSEGFWREKKKFRRISRTHPSLRLLIGTCEMWRWEEPSFMQIRSSLSTFTSLLSFFYCFNVSILSFAFFTSFSVSFFQFFFLRFNHHLPRASKVWFFVTNCEVTFSSSFKRNRSFLCLCIRFLSQWREISWLFKLTF